MKLSYKIFNTITINLIFGLVILFTFSKTIFLPRFTEFEIEKAKQNTHRIIKYIEKNIDKLNSIALDYSVWDDTYYFTENYNKNYITSNFTSENITDTFNVNFFIIVDNEKNIKLNLMTHDISENSYIWSYASQKNMISEIYSIMNNENNVKEVKGIFQTDNFPVLLAAQPILKSDGSGIPNGILILGQFLDNNIIDDISTTLHLNAEIKNYQQSAFDKNPCKQDDICIKIKDDDYIIGYGIINDIFDKPTLMVMSIIPREIYKNAKTNINSFLLIVLSIFIIFSIILLILLNKILIKKITAIKIIMDKISSAYNMSLRITLNGNDELTELGQNFNKMLDRLEQSNNDLFFMQKRFSCLFSNMLSSVSYNKILIDENGNPIDFMILEINDAFVKSFGFERENIINKKASQVFLYNNQNSINLIETAGKIALEGGHSVIDEIYLKDFSSWYSIVIYGVEKGYFTLVARDISEKKKAEQKILQLAYYDTLTQFPNRKKLMEYIYSLISNNENNFALFFIDLDNFKNINDTLGHYAGDFTITKVAHRLKTIINTKNIIGRLGGDEFIIIQKNIESKTEVKKLAEKICNLLKPCINYLENELYVSASIGISIYPYDGNNIAALMKNADTAMYVCKKNGGNGYQFYSKEMNYKSLDELRLKNSLRKALTKNEFVGYFQPIIDVDKMNIVGAEALIRWNFKDKIIYPGDFIEQAKDIGEIIKIDNWMLKNACLQCKRWHDQGFKDIYVSVNISFKQLQHKNFVNEVIATLESTGLNSVNLNLEITEDEAMEDVELTIHTLKQLRNKGIRISLDDFGTGYSSLSYVNSLPIDSLKIDKSLITFLDYNNKNYEIVKTIILMAHSLDIIVIAEGIEDEQQLQILKELKCDKIQGYFISKPIETKEFENKFLQKL
jgi:diguanylate cyclase (GGDEF)-like protein/PAS domain S-box-containing protein